MTAFLRLAACVALVLLGSPVSAAVLYAMTEPDDDDDDDSDLDEDDESPYWDDPVYDDDDDDYDPRGLDALAHPPTGDSDDVDDWPIPADTGGEASGLGATVRKAVGS